MLWGAQPRFKKGQVVVKGVPSDFPGYTIIKTLPHAGLVVLEVAPGKELAQIKRLKGESKKASLNFIVQQFSTVSDTYYYPYQWNFTTIQAEASDNNPDKIKVMSRNLYLGADIFPVIVAGPRNSSSVIKWSPVIKHGKTAG